MSLTIDQKKQKIKEIFMYMRLDALQFQQIKSISEIFFFPNQPKPQNMQTLKEWIIHWLIEHFNSVEHEIEKFIRMKPIQNEQARSLAYAILHNYRQRITFEEQKNSNKSHIPDKPSMQINPASNNPSNPSMKMPPPNMPSNGPSNMQHMPNYMNYPPYNYMSNYMMNNPSMMYQQPPPPIEQPSYENRQSYYHMNPYYMPMPMGYHPYYSYPNFYPPQMNSQINYNKYGPTGDPSDPYQKQKKPTDEPISYHTRKNGKRQSLTVTTIDECEQNYKKYFQSHGKKYQNGPFKIIPPAKPKPKGKVRIQAQKSVQLQQIPISMAKIPSQKEDNIQPSLPFNQQLKKCCCLGYSNQTQVFTCNSCKEKFHYACLKKKKEEPQKVCAFCFMREMDPFSSIIYCVTENYIQKISEQKKFSQVCNFQPILQFQKNKKTNEYDVEFRVMRLDDAVNEVPEFTWPDQSILWCENEKVFEFNALQYNSSMKKRKDSSLFLNSQFTTIKPQQKLRSINIKLEVKNLGVNQSNSKKIKNNFTFIFGIYLIKKNTIDELYHSVLNTPNNRDNFIQDYFANLKNEEEDDLKIQQVKINLEDPFAWTLIQTPARGAKCNHGQCFDLKTFLGFMNVQKYRSWKCPICPKICQKFRIDTQQFQILKLFKDKFSDGNQKISKEVTFHCDGRISFKEDKSQEQNQQENSNPQIKIGKTKLISKMSKKSRKSSKEEKQSENLQQKKDIAEEVQEEKMIPE